MQKKTYCGPTFATDMTVASIAVPDTSYSSVRDSSRKGFCMAMNSRVVSNAGCLPFHAALHMLRIKGVPCVLITISIWSIR